MKKLTILDFATGDVDIYSIDSDYESCIEDLLKELGHNADNCQWMFSEGNICFHKEVFIKI